MGAPSSPYQPYAARFRDPQGPGDGRPTALEMVHDVGLIGKMAGKVMMITGCTAGIGIETARAFHIAGVDVYMTVRDMARGEEVIEDIHKSSQGTGSLCLINMDLSSLESVRLGAKDFLSKSKQLNVLVTNAGIMMCQEGRTVDGFETQIGTNHFGHFLLFQLLKPTLLASSTPEFQSRVLTVASAGHRRTGIRFHDMHFEKEAYDKALAYGQSKTANIYMANSIDRHYGSKGLHAFSVHPGGVQTSLGRHLSGGLAALISSPEMAKIIKSPEQGAATQVWGALSPDLEGQGGSYLANCGEAAPLKEGTAMDFPVYFPHAYDEQAEERLWKLSYEAVGLQYEE